MSETSPTPILFQPIALRDVLSRNRIMISPMCQYAAEEGHATDWHMVHLGQYALGGAGIVFAEATAISEQGRISHLDLGLWRDSHIAPLRRVTAFLRAQGAVPGVQLSHAGRKAAAHPPWHGAGPLSMGENPWPVVGPSAIAADGGWQLPAALTVPEIGAVIEDWRTATRRAAAAGFDIVEIHGGHGYLVHQFLSPVSNQRDDSYGGDWDGRLRFALEVAQAVRAEWPAGKPVFFRVSALDGSGGQWTMEDTVALSRALKACGVDAIDCSTGGVTGPTPTRITRGYGFQAPFAQRVRQEADIMTVAVGLIVDPHQANGILASGQADLVAIAREALVDPYWAQHAQACLRADDFSLWPEPYRVWIERRAALMSSLVRPDWRS